jgi:hypothetical protein
MLEADSLLADLALRGAQAAMPTDPLQHLLPALAQQCRDAGPRNQPLLPLLMALLEATERVARAVDDNAWDASQPVPRVLAQELASQAFRLGASITNSSQCSDLSGWSLPRFSNRELV